jgi:hypothetical protein
VHGSSAVPDFLSVGVRVEPNMPSGMVIIATTDDLRAAAQYFANGCPMPSRLVRRISVIRLAKPDEREAFVPPSTPSDNPC